MELQRHALPLIVGIASLLALLYLIGIAVSSSMDAVGFAIDRVRYPQDPTLPFRRPVGPQVLGSAAAFWCGVVAGLALLLWACGRAVVVWVFGWR